MGVPLTNFDNGGMDLYRVWNIYDQEWQLMGVDGNLTNQLSCLREQGRQEKWMFECHRRTRRALITSSIALFHSPVQLWCFSVVLLVFSENTTSSWSLKGGNTHGDETDKGGDSKKGLLDDSDVEVEWERVERKSFRWRELWESRYQRDREDEESERNSCSTSTGRPLGFGVAGLGVFGEGGNNPIGDPGELQPELVLEESSPMSS